MVAGRAAAARSQEVPMKRTITVLIYTMGLTSIVHAQTAPPITNYHCAPSILEIFRDLNQKAVDAIVRPTLIYEIHCYSPTDIQTVLLRAGDGRLMQWKPSKGTNELKHMMLFGREPR
jgi:hypothetical protein